MGILMETDLPPMKYLHKNYFKIKSDQVSRFNYQFQETEVINTFNTMSMQSAKFRLWETIQDKLLCQFYFIFF